MTGLKDTDIRLDDSWQLTQAADGDAPLCSGLDCLYQNIVLEAITQPGDLTQRVKSKLQKREVILPETISVKIIRADDTFRLRCTFRFAGENEARALNIIIDAVSVEVTAA